MVQKGVNRKRDLTENAESMSPHGSGVSLLNAIVSELPSPLQANPPIAITSDFYRFLLRKRPLVKENSNQPMFSVILKQTIH